MESKQMGQVTAGAMLVALGVLLLGLQTGWWGSWTLGQLWPMILVAFGLVHVIGRRDCGSSFGWVLMGWGGILLLHTTGILPMRTSWPLAVVLSGLVIFFRAIGSRPRSRQGGPDVR